MMQTWTGGLCALAVAAAMVRLLSPGGSMGKMLRLVLGAMTLCVLLGPFLQGLPKAAALRPVQQTDTASSFTAFVQKQEVEAAKRQAVSLAGEKLHRSGISYESLTVQIDTSQAGSIRISRVTAVGVQAGCGEQARVLLRQALGTDVEVEIRGG